MKFNRNIIVCVLAIVCEAIPDEFPHLPSRSLLFFPSLLAAPNKKPFSIFSRPLHPPPEEEQHKGGIVSHVGNVLHGGSIGFEIRPLAPLQGILDHAKKFMPGRGTAGRPSHKRPDQDRPNHENNDKERPHGDRPNQDRPQHERPNYEHPNQERPKKHQPRPNQPPKEEEDWETHKKDPEPGPQWEDIGEVPGDEEDYGEGILQPRRPKRFVESKIYHVPLLFRSNGRADRIRIKGRNGLRDKITEN